MNIIILVTYFFVVNIHDAFGSISNGDSLSDLKNISTTTKNKNNSNYSEIILKINNFIYSEKYDEAIAYFDKLLEIDPTNSVVLNNKANTLFKQEKYDEALQYYERALSQQPTFINATNNMALILDKQKKYDEAIEYYDKVLALDPSNVEALNGKAFANANLDKSE